MNAHHLALDPSADNAFVGSVEQRLAELLEAHHPGAEDRSAIADEAAGYLTRASSAKRARPRLVHQFGAALDVESDAMVNMASAAELIHTASLLHDDVVDDATTRRGRQAANVRWGNQVAILGGDLLLCHSLKLLEGYPIRVYHSAVDVIMEMTRGIVREVEARFDSATSLGAWQHIAMGKTAALLGWCGYAPAMIAEKPELAERFDRCGRHLGIAFQLADDLKDLLDADTGKDRFADIRNGNPSYPLLWAADADDEIRAMLDDAWGAEAPVGDADEVERIGEAVLRSDAVGQTVEVVDHEIAQALSALGAAGDRPGGRQVRSWAKMLLGSVEYLARDCA
ncbi:MAG: polyprenyl synthetase family protein [Persicimonas sp.]